MPRKKQTISCVSTANLMRKVLDENAMDVQSMRIGDDGAEQLGIFLYERAREITLRAAKFALHGKRKTIKRSDVELATRG